jgi:P27 family predicted phage terminase small subunit
MKLVTGNPGKRALNKREAAVSGNLPLCPEWLPDEAKRVWNGLAPDLNRAGLLASPDAAKFAAFCLAVANLRSAVEELQSKGTYIPTDKGNIVQHPAVGVMHRSMELIGRLGGDFGLDPAARSRIQATPPGDDEDELGEFLQQKRRA